jgi:hypothetical protein
LQELHIEGRIILKWILRNMVQLDWNDWGQSPVVVFCEYGNKLSSYIKLGNFPASSETTDFSKMALYHKMRQLLLKRHSRLFIYYRHSEAHGVTVTGWFCTGIPCNANMSDILHFLIWVVNIPDSSNTALWQ